MLRVINAEILVILKGSQTFLLQLSHYMIGRCTKAKKWKQTLHFFVKEYCFTRFSSMHIKYALAIEKHNSGWRENRGGTLGGNLAN